MAERISPLSTAYRIAGAICGIAGVLVIFFVDPSKTTWQPVAGIAVFAALYVIAQAAERLVEWVVEGLKLIPDSPGAEKQKLQRMLRAENSTSNGNPTTLDVTEKAEKEAEVEERRTDIRFLGHGLSILLCALAVTWMNYGIMNSLGASGMNADLDRLLTALAAAGGSKGLHELIGRVQAAKENAQTAA